MVTTRITTHPGAILQYEFLEPLGVEPEELARHIGVPASELSAVICGTRAVDARLAWLLSMAFGTTPQFWLNLQTSHSLSLERPKEAIPLLPRVTV
jgi:antitoxin HigA-1